MSDIAQLADELKTILKPACERIELAGSIRRSKPDPKDIEICAIPRFIAQSQAGLFGDEMPLGAVNQLDDLVEMLANGEGDWEFDPVTRRNGHKYKRLRHRETLIACDLFITDARRWGAILAIRTGPADFSKALVGLALLRGMFVDEGLLHQHHRQYKMKNGERVPLPCSRGDACSLIVPTREEKDFFQTLGVAWLEPAKRTLARLIRRRT